MTFWMDVQYSYLMFLICTSRQGFYMSLTNANINNTVHHGYSCTEWRSLLCSCCWWKRYGVKGKVGRLCICCVVVWLVLVYGEIWGQLKKSTPPPSSPSEGRRGTVVLLQSDRKQMVPFTFTDEERQYLSEHRRVKSG